MSGTRFAETEHPHAPHRKVSAAVLGGAVATLVAWVVSLAGVDMPGPVVGSVATLASGVCGWVTRS